MKSFLVLPALLLSLWPTPGDAGPGSSASLILAGIVPSELSVTMTSAAQGAWRNFAASPHEDIEVARIVEINNTFGTYVVTVSSRNHGMLGDGVSYVLKYNDSPVDLRAGQSIVASGPRESGTTTTHILRLHITDGPDAVPPGRVLNGHYSDTIVFSVAAP